jgi:hypothetical protein
MTMQLESISPMSTTRSTALRGGSLRVAADGSSVVARDGDELYAIDPRDGSARWRIRIDGVRDHALAGDRVWAITQTSVVELVLATGAERVRHVVPWGDGPVAAVPWLPNLLARGGDAPWLLAAETGTVTSFAACELALPVGGGRILTVRGGVAELERAGTTVWKKTVGDRAVGGALVLEGRAAALCLARPGGAMRVVVINVRDGAVLHALGVTDATQVVFAPRRGWAVVLADTQRLTVIDLRLGRIICSRVESETIDEIAVDASFERVLMRVGAPPRLVVVDPDALLAGPDDAGTPAPLETLAEPTPVELASAQPAPAVAARPLPEGPLVGLASLREPADATADEVAVDVQARLYWIGALVDHAIAEGWDTGRIAAPSSSALPFEHEVTATLHRSGGLAAAQLERARRHVEHYRDVVADVIASRAGRTTPLARVARELSLSPLAIDLVVAAAAPLLWGELARLYGILGNDPARPLCDELLLCQLMAPLAPRGEVSRELDPDGPLRRYGLVHVSGRHPRPFGAIGVDPAVIALLRGIELETAVDHVAVRRASVPLEQVRIDARVRDRLVAALATPAAAPVRIALRGRLGSGRRTFAAALAARCDRELGIVDGSGAALEPADRVERVRAALLRCRMFGWIPCVEGLDDIAVTDHPAAAVFSAMFAAHPGPLLVRLPAEATIPLLPGHRRVDLRALTEGERTEAWTEALRARELPADDAGELAARFRVGPGLIARTIETAAATLHAEGEPLTAETTTRAIDGAVRQHLEDRLGTIASRVTRLAGWSDLILPEDVLDSLLDLVSRVRRRKLVFETWGYERKITSARGVTALLQGGPGTGKTLAAGVIARELGLDLYRIDVARIVSKWVGETEKNLATVFDAAEDGQAVLLFDEADSLFGKRTEVKSSVDRYANLEVNYLLQRLDSFEGIAILTTNFGTSIDPAFKRRLGMRLTLPFPDEDMREKMWSQHVPPEVPRSGDLDFTALAKKFRLSGGYIRNAALRAAFLAAEEGVALGQQHFERAIRLEFREVGKLSESGALE